MTDVDRVQVFVVAGALHKYLSNNTNISTEVLQEKRTQSNSISHLTVF